MNTGRDLDNKAMLVNDTPVDDVTRVLVHTLCRRRPNGETLAQVLGVDHVPHLPVEEET